MDDLLRRFRAGDEEAVRELYRRHGGAVATVARSFVGDRELVADVVQQTFLQAWRKASTFDEARPFAPWLYAIARRASIDVLRRERRPTTGDHEPEVDVAIAGPSLERTWEIHQVRLAIDALPDDEREVVRLSHLVGLSHPEIASRLQIPVGTVKSRSGRAHKRLAAALRHIGDEADPPANRTTEADVEERRTTT
jgi:RNA polymerase sigma-70 factor (ECF subfamily)